MLTENAVSWKYVRKIRVVNEEIDTFSQKQNKIIEFENWQKKDNSHFWYKSGKVQGNEYFFNLFGW